MLEVGDVIRVQPVSRSKCFYVNTVFVEKTNITFHLLVKREFDSQMSILLRVFSSLFSLRVGKFFRRTCHRENDRVSWMLVVWRPALRTRLASDEQLTVQHHLLELNNLDLVFSRFSSSGLILHLKVKRQSKRELLAYPNWNGWQNFQFAVKTSWKPLKSAAQQKNSLDSLPPKKLLDHFPCNKIRFCNHYQTATTYGLFFFPF